MPLARSIGLLLIGVAMTVWMRPERSLDTVPTVACFAVAGEQAGTKNARMRHGARSGTLSRQRGTRTSHARPTHDQ